MTAVMNRLRYDAAVIGNHEFDWGVPILRERRCGGSVPRSRGECGGEGDGRAAVLAPAVHDRRAGRRTLRRDRARHGRHAARHPSLEREGLRFLDPAPVAQEWIDTLVPDSADAAVLLVHIGGVGLTATAWPVRSSIWRGPCGVRRRFSAVTRTASSPLRWTACRWSWRGHLFGLCRVDLDFDGGSESCFGRRRVVPVYADSVDADDEVPRWSGVSGGRSVRSWRGCSPSPWRLSPQPGRVPRGEPLLRRPPGRTVARYRPPQSGRDPGGPGRGRDHVRRGVRGHALR